MAAIISGQKTVTANGTAEQLGSQLINGPLMIKALIANTNNIYVGNVSGDVASTNGIELAAGDAVIFDFVGDLANIWIDADTNDEGVSWIMLEV
jgi:hypothetical protein